MKHSKNQYQYAVRRLKTSVNEVKNNKFVEACLNPIIPGGGFGSPQVRKNDCMLSKRISYVTKLLDFS